VRGSPGGVERHFSYASLQEGRDPIEVEADSFAAGLLMPTRAVTWLLRREPRGLKAVLTLKSSAFVSLTAAAIRAAPLAPYPMAAVLSRGDQVTSSYLSGPMKALRLPRCSQKGDPLPNTVTREFKNDRTSVRKAETWCGGSDAADWLGRPEPLALTEDVVGLGRSGGTLTILTLRAA
jgi:hypothetical protein